MLDLDTLGPMLELETDCFLLVGMSDVVLGSGGGADLERSKAFGFFGGDRRESRSERSTESIAIGSRGRVSCLVSYIRSRFSGFPPKDLQQDPRPKLLNCESFTVCAW